MRPRRSRSRFRRLRLEPLQHRAIGGEGGGEQRAAAAGAGVERDREFTLDETTHLPVEAADHPAKAVERRGKIEDVPASPPEGVALRGERARCVDPGMNE